MKKRAKMIKKVGLTLATLGIAAVSNAAMANWEAESNGGFALTNPDCCDYWFAIGGRLAFDETWFSGNSYSRGFDFPTGANIRYGRLKFIGGVGDCWGYNMTLNFTGSLVNFEDLWLNYSGLAENIDLRVGQFTPFETVDGWGVYGTLSDTIFLEPSLATSAFSTGAVVPNTNSGTFGPLLNNNFPLVSLVPNKGLGIWLHGTFCDMFTAGLAVYQPQQSYTTLFTNVDPSVFNYQNPSRSDRLGEALRITFSPVHCDGEVYHLGFLGRYQSINKEIRGAALVQPNFFFTTPEAIGRNTTALLNTGPIRARSYTHVAGDALAIWGPFTVEAEYRLVNVQRVPTITDVINVGNVHFHGWHAQAAYVLTGESRTYNFKNGTLHNPVPCGDCGAWEIAARYSEINLVNKNIYGGSEHNVTVGLNWFPNSHVRVALNYIHADIRATNTSTIASLGTPLATTNSPLKRRLDIVGLRFQVVF
jgi:phosphate-selective porin OprO/OprP